MVAVIDIEPIRERFSAVAPFLDERGRRLVAAAEAFAAGYGGIAAVAMATGVAPSTIGRGLKELAQDEPPASARAGSPPRIRRPGAGRQRTISKDPRLLPDLEALVEPTTRGDPQSPLRWTCKSVRHLAQALQYAMRDRLVALGWSEVDTVDDDLGRSAAGGVTRVGFERMVAEVCLGKVGAVAAREVSRFARNSHD